MAQAHWDNGPDDEGDAYPEDLSPEELREQLAAERAARAAEREARERGERRLDEMLRGSRPANTQTPAPLGPPPNAAEDPEGFQRWMVEREARAQRELEARLERQQNELRQSVSAESRASLLWERFRAKYPVYAQRTRLVEVAYGELLASGRLPTDNDRAVDAVKREMDSMAGLPLDRAAAPDDRTVDQARFARPSSPRRKKEPVEEPPKSMSDAIYEQQVKAGLR